MVEQDGAAQFVTKYHVAEMLEVQESMFRSLFDSMIVLTGWLDSLFKSNSNVKTLLAESMALFLLSLN